MRARGAQVDRHRGPGGRGRRRRHAADDRGAQPRQGGRRADRGRGQQDRQAEGANPDKVRRQLTEYGLVAEEYGGDTMFVDMSAKPGIGIDEPARGRPAHRRRLAGAAGRSDEGRAGCRDRGAPRQGPRRGRDRAGPAGHAAGRRLDRRPAAPTAASGRCSTRTATTSTEAGPARPVLVLGLTAVPGAGDTFLVVDDDRMARQIAEQRRRASAAPTSPSRGRPASPSRTWSRPLKEGEEHLAQPHPQGRRLRFGRGPRGRAAQDRRRRRGPAPGHPPRRRCDHRERRQPGDAPPTRSSSASTSGPRAAPRAGRPRGRGDPLLHGHLPGHRGDRGGAQGHAQAGVRGGRARHGGDPRGLPLVQDRQHRRCHGPVRARSRRNAKARIMRDGEVVADNLTISSLRGSRTTPPRSARASSAVSASATSTTSRSATSSRPSRCARSRAPDPPCRSRPGPAAGASAGRRRPLGDAESLPQRGGVAVDPVRRAIRLHTCMWGRCPSTSCSATSIAEGEAIRRPPDRRRAPAHYAVTAAEAGHLDLHRRAEVGVAVVAGEPGTSSRCSTCERLVAGRPEVELLSVRRRLPRRRRRE